MKRQRPKRSTSLNVDYDLKKSKIILPEESRKYKKRNKLNNTHNTNNTNNASMTNLTNLANFSRSMNRINKDGSLSNNDTFHRSQKRFVGKENRSNNGKKDNNDQFKDNLKKQESTKSINSFGDSDNNDVDDKISEVSDLLVKDKDGNVIDIIDDNLLTTTRLKLNKDSTNNSTGQDISMNGLLNTENEVTVNDVLSRTTGLPLSYFPNEKIKKERLWNYKKILKQEKNVFKNNMKLQNEKIDKNDNKDKTYNFNDTNKTTKNVSTLSPMNSNNSSSINIQNKLNNELQLENYNNNLKTNEYKSISHESCLRHVIGTDRDILDSRKDVIINPIPVNSHVKSKPLISKNKLFNQDSFNEKDSDTIDINNNFDKNSSTTPVTLTSTPVPIPKKDKNIKSGNNINVESDSELDFENDDFCSTCKQSGSFLCCDTCPKSFHFLCLDPPIDPNNLPEGNWSCINCQFKSLNSTNKFFQINEKEFINDRKKNNKSNIFDKLIFHLNSINSKQFSLPNSIKDTFKDVRTGDNSQYLDDTEKIPLTERQMFNTSYGQSITKLDSYSPENHFDSNNNLLICYRCHQTRLGTWNKPEDSRLLIKCDYCNTPWHLDCIPNVPRASLKNLGLKWKCPLHANTIKQRRLTKRQPYLEPSNQVGFKNNGDIEITLDEIESYKKMNDWKKFGQFEPIAKLSESSVKFDFVSKIYDYKRLAKKNEIKLQENLIDKLIYFQNSNSNVSELSSLLYFKYCNDADSTINTDNKKLNDRGADGSINKIKKLKEASTNVNWKKIWDFKELCQIANKEFQITKENKNVMIQHKNEVEKLNDDDKATLTMDDINQLLFIKKIIESKPREEVINFFNLANNLQQ